MENLTDLDLLCMYAIMGGVNGKQVTDYVKDEQRLSNYSEKGYKLLEDVQRSVESPSLYDISDVPYMKVAVELISRGLLDDDSDHLKAMIKALEGNV